MELTSASKLQVPLGLLGRDIENEAWTVRSTCNPLVNVLWFSESRQTLGSGSALKVTEEPRAS